MNAFSRREAPRVWVIGLDGATWELMGRYMEEGKLPVLEGLCREGVWGILRSTEPPLSPAAWTTFATGKRPGKHGVLDHIYRKEGSYGFSFVNATLRGATPIWGGISRVGKKVGVINVPLTYPPEPVNGFMITGMYTPSDRHPFTYPPGLAEELRQKIGGYRVFGPRSKEDLCLALRGIMEGLDIRTRTAIYLLEAYDPELFILVFSATDTVQHKFWKFMDPGHPDYREDVPPGFATAIEDVYKEVDRRVGQILERAPEGTTIIIMSDHGASPLYKYIYLNNWLLREGLMRIREGVLPRMRYGFYRLGLTPFNLLNKASRIKPGFTDMIVGRVRREMSGGRSRFHDLFLSWRDIDWERTRAYSIGGNLGGVYVNLKGREPQGTVEAGNDYEALRDELIERLKGMVDPDTGEPVVETAYRREELYEGPFIERIPDVIFTTRGGRYMVFGVHEFASNAVMEPSPWFSGAHSPEGVLIINGDSVRKGEIISGARIEDLAPTVLHLLGLPIPEDMDGRVLEDAFDPAYLRDNPVIYTGTWDVMGRDLMHFMPDEEEAVRRRLEGLGYL